MGPSPRRVLYNPQSPNHFSWNTKPEKNIRKRQLLVREERNKKLRYPYFYFLCLCLWQWCLLFSFKKNSRNFSFFIVFCMRFHHSSWATLPDNSWICRIYGFFFFFFSMLILSACAMLEEKIFSFFLNFFCLFIYIYMWWYIEKWSQNSSVSVRGGNWMGIFDFRGFQYENFRFWKYFFNPIFEFPISDFSAAKMFLNFPIFFDFLIFKKSICIYMLYKACWTDLDRPSYIKSYPLDKLEP